MQANTTAKTALSLPTSLIVSIAILRAIPVSSMTLPKTAPKRKIGKNDLIYITALTINSSVYPGKTGNPEIAAANNAKTGANKITENPRYANVTKRNKLRMIATISIKIHSFSYCYGQ